MNSSLSPMKTEVIGVLVLEEFACSQAQIFIETIDQSKETSRQHLRWSDPSIRPEEGFYSLYGKCDLVTREKSIDLHLFGLPTSLLPSFNLSDLIFPVNIRACLLLVNQEMNPATWPKDRFLGWLDWIRAQKVLYLVAVTGSDAPALPISEFLGYLSLEPETQIVELPSHQVGDSITDHIFELSSAKQVLTTLVENIITNMSHTSDPSE